MSEAHRHAYDVHPLEALEEVIVGDKVRFVIDNDQPKGASKRLDGLCAEFIGEVVDDDAKPRAYDGVDVVVRWADTPDEVTHIRRESPVGAHVLFGSWCVDVEFDFGGGEIECYIADEFKVVSNE